MEGGGGEKQGQSRCSVMWWWRVEVERNKVSKMFSDVVWRVEVESRQEDRAGHKGRSEFFMPVCDFILYV